MFSHSFMVFAIDSLRDLGFYSAMVRAHYHHFSMAKIQNIGHNPKFIMIFF